MASSAEAYEEADTTYYGMVSPPFLTPCVVREVFLTSSMRNLLSLYLLSNRAWLLLAPAIAFILKHLSTGDGFQLR